MVASLHDDAFIDFLSADPHQGNVGQLASIGPVVFDAQTLTPAQVTHILVGSEAPKKADLVRAERI